MRFILATARDLPPWAATNAREIVQQATLNALRDFINSRFR